MKRFVDGVERELPESSAVVVQGEDRLYVRTANGTSTAVAIRSGDATLVSYKGRQYRVERAVARAKAGTGSINGEVRAPMPGLIIDVLVTLGQEVRKGARLLVLEAMKTQQPFAAPFDGTVEKLEVVKGEQVQDGALLAQIKPAD